MKSKSLGQLQLGKNGITENFLGTLKSYFKNHKNVKISVLKSAGHEKNKVKIYAEEILGELGNNYTARVIGFTINVKKWKRTIRS